MTRLKEFSRKIKSHHPILIIVGATFAVYFNVLFNGFVLDDSFQVIGNRWITNIRYIPEIFSSPFVLGGKWSFYRPMIHVFYMITYFLFGLKAWGYHLVNILFHAANSTLVFFIADHILRKSRKQGFALPPSGEARNEGLQWIPFAAALLFVTHPIHTESVAWISVTDLFLSFFYLLSFYFYIRSADLNSPLSGSYSFSVASFFLATLCKEPGLTLPAVLIAYDYAFRKEGSSLSYYVKRYVPFLAAAGVYFVLRLRALGGLIPYKKTPLESSLLQDVINVIVLFKKYIEKLLFPSNLNVWHAFLPPETFLNPAVIISGFIAICFLVMAVSAVRKSRSYLVGIMFIVVPLLPALYLPAITQGLDNAFFERYTYLPSVGFVLLMAFLMAWANDRGPRWTAALITVFSIATVLYSIATITRNTAWKDNYTIWSDAAGKSPSSAVPRNGLAAALREDGRYDDAIEQYLIAVKLDPANASSHASLGLVYVDKGWTDKAMEQFQTAIALYPGYAEAHDFLGVLYGSLGRQDSAIAEFQTALNLNPDLDYLYKHLGIAYSNVGRMDKAIEYFQTEIRLDPGDADTHNNLGVIYAEKGIMEKAAAQFEEASRLKPTDPSFHYNAARAYQRIGRTNTSEEHIRIAKGLERGNP